MSCFNPIQGFRSRVVNESGKRSIVFNRNDGFLDMPVSVPCGKCIGCRLDYARGWAIRLIHESQLYKNSIFITLTYNDDNLPKNGCLEKEEFKLFMKRLRISFERDKLLKEEEQEYIHTDERPIRFFHCGEYGEKNFRPHYHAILFGIDFKDKEYWKTHNKNRIYISKKLEKLWNEKGFCTIGSVTIDSCGYVARYVTKKMHGNYSIEKYYGIDYQTGEVIYERPKEYCTMSRRSGIGSDWISKYSNDVYSQDFIIHKGKRLKAPKFYDKFYETFNKSDFERIKKLRQKNGVNNPDNTIERLFVREQIKLEKLKLLQGAYENEN